MLKKIVASLLTSVGLLSFNVNFALAERAVNFKYYRTVYPSTCNIAFEEEVYGCNSAVIGGFNNASANIKHQIMLITGLFNSDAESYSIS